MSLLQCFRTPDFTSVSLSILAGTTLTIFFKRNFRLESHVLPLRKRAAALGILWAPTAMHEIPVPLRVIQAGLMSTCAVKEITDSFSREEQWKALVLSACVLLPSVIPEGPHILSFLAVCCATTQFLRWPTELKNWLSELRIICGPAYVLLVVGAWVNSGRISSNLLLTAAASLSSFAAIFLRPDNSELLVCAGLPVPVTSTRKLAHGASMFLSFICITAHSLWFQKLSLMFLEVVGFGAILNSLLYLGVADFPRKCWATISRCFYAAMNT